MNDSHVRSVYVLLSDKPNIDEVLVTTERYLSALREHLSDYFYWNGVLDPEQPQRTLWRARFAGGSKIERYTRDAVAEYREKYELELVDLDAITFVYDDAAESTAGLGTLVVAWDSPWPNRLVVSFTSDKEVTVDALEAGLQRLTKKLFPNRDPAERPKSPLQKLLAEAALPESSIETEGETPGAPSESTETKLQEASPDSASSPTALEDQGVSLPQAGEANKSSFWTTTTKIIVGVVIGVLTLLIGTWALYLFGPEAINPSQDS